MLTYFISLYLLYYNNRNFTVFCISKYSNVLSEKLFKSFFFIYFYSILYCYDPLKYNIII